MHLAEKQNEIIISNIEFISHVVFSYNSRIFSYLTRITEMIKTTYIYRKQQKILVHSLVIFMLYFSSHFQNILKY